MSEVNVPVAGTYYLDESIYSFTTTGPKDKEWREAHAIKVPKEKGKKKAYQSKWPS